MRSLFLFILCFLFSCNKHFESPQKLHPSFVVIHITDGDTFWVDNDSAEGLKIRLIGVDAPESQSSFNRTKGFYGEEAKEFLRYLIFNLTIKLEFDIDSLHSYGRTLAYAYLSDGRMVNEILVEEGYARVATYPPNVKYVDLFIAAQVRARDANKGIWQ